MKPLLYFSYGMTKSGSTLACQLVRTALAAAGMPQPRLNASAIATDRRTNFIEHLSQAQVDELLGQARALGHIVVLKTHTRPDNPAVVSLLQSGLAIGHAVCRDPRDMALSMLDHAARSRRLRRPSFSELHGLDAAIDNIRHQTNSLTAWLRLPNVLSLCYDELAFDTARAARRILRQLGLNMSPGQLAELVLASGQTNKNSGKSARHIGEMPASLAQSLGAEFAPMLNTLITHRAALPQDGAVALPPPAELRIPQISEPAL
ncbi:MAG: sulfotransferase domain-containing protein [Paracoccaceae bacterium]